MKKCLFCLILIIPLFLKAGTTVIHVETEGWGTITDIKHDTLSTNGAFFWNGTKWVTNETAIHMFYTDLRTGKRLKEYNIVNVSDRTAISPVFDSLSFHITRQNYQYTYPAKQGGNYQYEAVEYLIGDTTAKQVVIRSRGTGNGIENSYFDIFVGVKPNQVTAIRNDPQWFTYPAGMSMDEALEQTNPTQYLTGTLPTTDGYYFMDINGGSDMAGTSYNFHTGQLTGNPNTEDLSPSYPTDFMLKFMDSKGLLEEFKFLPELISERYNPPANSFVLTNEGNSRLIDRLVAAGCTNLYEALVYLRNHLAGDAPATLTGNMDALINALNSISPNGEVFTESLSSFTDPAANPVAINPDGTFILADISVSAFDDHNGYERYSGNELFTYATSPDHYIYLGSSTIGNPPITTDYKAFAIAWNADPIIYVNHNSTGSNNGTSWANAYTSLQSALSEATSGQQIWVAKGTYKPTTGTDRTVSFQMKSGVKIYGGFAGTETSINQRTNYSSGETNETILSGNIGAAGANTDNSYHIVSSSGVDSTALLDGFTITGGYAYLYSEQNYSQAMGGGMYNLNGSPTITNCVFTGNHAYYGGGMYNENSSPSVTDCLFQSNSTQYDGGGIFNYNNSHVTITNCTFTLNSAESGGGIENYSNPYSVIFGCKFFKNSAKYGGGINNVQSSNTITNCFFSGNTAEYGGGLENNTCSPVITNCTFSANSASNTAGGLYNMDATPTVKNSVFWGNFKTGDLSVSEIYGGTAGNFTYCCIRRGETIYTGIGNIFSNPMFTDIDGTDNISGTSDDDCSLRDNSNCIGAATETGAPATDILGATRGTPPDMGAYENRLNQPKIKIIYVKANAPGIKNGTSWDDAYTSLVPALEEATMLDQIWIAKGVYKPTDGTDRSASFRMKNDVIIYGGFAGTEAELSFRKNYGPGQANETFLSGNIGSESDSTDNSYHVFYHSEELLLDSSAVIDGVTITGGYANGTDDYWGSPSNHGGGMINYQASPTIRNCSFTGNSANDGGGGMFNWDHSSPEITGCLFTRNHVFGVTATEEGGGGMYNDNQSSPVITNCTFSYNTAYVVDGSSVFSHGGGGGLYSDNGSSPVIDQCRFIGNFTDFFGGGVNYYLSTANITRCVFDGNEGFGGGVQLNSGQKGTISNCLFTNNKGGGIYAAMETSAKVVNCTFSKNSGDYACGLRVYNNSCHFEIINSVFWGNTQSGSNHIEITKYDNVVATNCCIQSGSDRFSGNNNIFTNPFFDDAANGDFHLSAGSPCISKGLNPAENILVPSTDLEGNVRPLGSKTDMGAYECENDATYPKATTFVISNEAPGYLIDNLIAQGYGDSCLYAVMEFLQPLSGGAISQWFMDSLAICPAGSEIFTEALRYFSINYPVCINSDGTISIQPIYAKDLYGKEGYATYPEQSVGDRHVFFTYTISPNFFINAGQYETTSGGTVTNYYKAFAIAWSLEKPTTVVLTNEGGLINNLIAAGYGDSTLYEVLVALQPNSGGIISDEFMSTLANTPAGSEIFTAKLEYFSGMNNPVCMNSDGTVSIQPIFAKDIREKKGYSTYPKQNGTRELFTYATSPEYYLKAGEKEVYPTVYYKAFVIVWSEGLTLSASPSALNVASSAGSTASFTIYSNTSWTVSSNQSWLTASLASDRRNRNIILTAQQNTTLSTRTAIVTISAIGVASKIVTVTQTAGTSSSLSVSPTTLNVASANGSIASFNITSNSNWTAVSSQSWLSVSPASGSSNETVAVTATANPLATTRTATVTVSGSGVTSQTVTVTQTAGATTLSVSPTALNIASANGSTATFNISSNISWSTASSQTWLSVSLASGIGNGTVTITAEANPTNSTRTATITVSGSGATSQTVTITQAAGAATLSVSPTALNIASANGSTATFNVTSNINWTAVSNQSWLSVNPSNGTGNGTVTVTAEANPLPTTRTVTVTISGSGVTLQTVTVTQFAGEATLSVSANALDIASANGSTALFNVISNISWVVSSSQTWLIVSPASGTDNGTVTVTADSNMLPTTRSATVTVSGSGAASQTVTVIQLAGAATLLVMPFNLDIGATEGSTSTVDITSNTTWSASSDQAWLSLSPTTGDGDGAITLTAEGNSTNSERTAIVTVTANGIASQNIGVTQAARVGISNNNIAEILVYPNPFSDGFYVCSRGNTTIVSVFDIRGRLLLTRKISDIEFIPAIQFKNGIYLLELTNDQITVNKKLIKN